MSKVAWNSAQAADKRIAKEQWNELVKILEKNYKIKSMNSKEVFLNIPGEDKGDIEIFVAGPPAVEPFHVGLWYFDLGPNKEHLKSGTCTSVSGVITRIDEIINAVKLKKKFG